MAELTWLTKGGLPPQGLPRIYVACRPEQAEETVQLIANDLVSAANCSVWYDEDPQADHSDPDTVLDLTQMSAFVFPVTERLLCEPNRARDVDLPLALTEHIPIIPIMLESGLDEEFARIFGDLQYLDRLNEDETATPYPVRLEKRLSAILADDRLSELVRKAFIARAFLSYRKKDRAHAQQLMRLLHQNPRGRDIAIWYDEFLTPGEDFNEAIASSLEEADLFLLTVTPNLLEDPNYVKDTEYPLAVSQGKPIVAASMVSTDEEDLRTHYEDLPNVASVTDESTKTSQNAPTLAEAIEAALDSIDVSDAAQGPEHDFFIGAAYMNGIDVEIDRERGVKLIRRAADSGYAEAMSFFEAAYWNGIGVERSYSKSIEWCEKAADAFEAAYRAAKDEEKESAAISYQIELNILIEHLNDVGRLTEAERACSRLKQLGEEWRTWSDSYNAFLASYVACAWLTNIYTDRSLLSQAQEQCDQAYELLVQRQIACSDEGIDGLILGNLIQSATIAMQRMDFHLAHSAFLEALKLAEAKADESYNIDTIIYVNMICLSLATIDLLRCRTDDAIAQSSRALTIAREMTTMDSAEEKKQLAPLGILCEAYRNAGRLSESLAEADGGLEIAASVRSNTDANSYWVYDSMNLYMAKGSCLFELHRWSECFELGSEMLDLAAELEGNEASILSFFAFMGHFYHCYAALNQGRVSEAIAHCEHMESCLPVDWENAEDTTTLNFGARLLECQGLIARAQGATETAQACFDAMRAISERQLDEYGLFQAGLDHGYACLQSCEIALDKGDAALAASFAAEGCKIFEALVSMGRVAANTRYYCDMLRQSGQAALLAGRTTEALEPLSKAVELGDDLLTWDESEDARTIVAECYYVLGEYYKTVGDMDQSETCHLEAFRLSSESAERTGSLRARYDKLVSAEAVATLLSDDEINHEEAARTFAWRLEELRSTAPEIRNYHALF